MQYATHKEMVIRVASHLFLRTASVDESHVDSILQAGLNVEVFDSPALAVDHIRVGLVELGLLRREPNGSLYCIDLNEFVSQSNIRGIFGRHYPCERIAGAEHLEKKIMTLARKHNLIAG